MDLSELAELAYAVKRDEVEMGKELAVPAIVDWLRDKFAQRARLAVLARSESGLLGWLMLVVQNAARVEVNPWFLGGHPLVAPGQDRRAVGASLLLCAIDWARSAGYKCVEFSVEQDPGATLEELRAQIHWYERLGFHIREEHVGLLYRVTERDPTSVSVPPGFELRPVGQVDQPALYRCYYHTFRSGQSRFFFDQSHRERRAHFRTFGKTYGIVDGISVAAIHGRRIAGFTYVMPVTETHVHLDWMGVHPDFRRQGLGRFLLGYAVSGAAALGVRTMSLSCDVENTHALDLYRSSGWQEMEKGITYAANVEGKPEIVP